MSRARLCFEGMSERHAELAWRFGEPDELQAAGPVETRNEELWVLESPLPAEAELPEHLVWVSECLRPHEAFVGELISLGGRVVLRLEIGGAGAGTAFAFNARLLLPLAHAGVRIEFSFGS